MDHIPYFLVRLGKHKDLSHITNLRNHFLETFKCPMLYRGSHYRGGGHTDEFDAQLVTSQRLMYGGVELGNNHRTITEVLEIKEVQRFIEDGKDRKGFRGDADIQALDISIWNNFGIDPDDVRGCTEDEYNEDFSNYGSSRQRNDGGRKMKRDHRRKYWNWTLVRIMIKLSVKCRKCEMCFKNIRRTRLGDVEYHHLNKRSDYDGMEFADAAAKLFVDDFVNVLKEGDADVWCVLCHKGESRKGE